MIADGKRRLIIPASHEASGGEMQWLAFYTYHSYLKG